MRDEARVCCLALDPVQSALLFRQERALCPGDADRHLHAFAFVTPWSRLRLHSEDALQINAARLRSAGFCIQENGLAPIVKANIDALGHVGQNVAAM